jgi:hypothetical protein
MGFTNPVYGGNFADPHVIAVDGGYYAFATNGPLGNVQTLRSADLVSWDQVGDALPELPAWSSPGKVWEPEVAVHAPDRFVMYYTTSDDASGWQSVSVAVASDPKGPYVDKSSRPLIRAASPLPPTPPAPAPATTWCSTPTTATGSSTTLGIRPRSASTHPAAPSGSPNSPGPATTPQSNRQ